MKVVLLVVITLLLINKSLGTNTNYGTITFVSTNTYATSKDFNALYAVGSTDRKIYRLNYTRNLTVASYNYNISTTHTATVRTIAVSPGERYVATGSNDYTIEVVEAYPRTKVCTFINFNQLRDIVFHPLYEEIFYSASIDDMIRKYNITNCSKLAEKAVGGSVHTMLVNANGDYLAYGTYQGHVGKIDQNLTAFTLSSKAHFLTVMHIFQTYPNYYITIGDDNKVILWNSGTIVHSFGTVSATKLKHCGMIEQYDEKDQHRVFGCADRGSMCYTLITTNTTINRFTCHTCTVSSSNWVDFRRMSPDQQVWLTQSSNTLYYHKVYQENGTLCNSATYHFGVDTVEKKCRYCGYTHPNCHFCQGNTCNTCCVGSYDLGATCGNCPDNCADCSSLTSCDQCAPGFEPNGGSAAGTCKAISTSQIGCFKAYNSNNGVGVGNIKCSTAGNGYYITNNDSKPCSNAISNCMECTQTSTPTCLACRTGNFLDSTTNRCISCAASLNGCLACFTTTNCLKCPVAFLKMGSNNNCSNCYGTCQTCLTYYNECETCYLAQNRYLSGTQCLCKDGYYDLSSAGVFACPLCSSVLTFCYLCTNSTICIQCHTNYYKVVSGGKTQCQTCSKYCQTCNGTSSNCTACNSITYFRQLSGSTCVCMAGYVSVGGSVSCLPCNRLNDGCTDCTNQTWCNSCDIGYYLKTLTVSSRLCQLCPYYCPSCYVNGAGTVLCTSCPAGTHRTLVAGNCTCDVGYFDDNRTLTCEKCSDVLSNCLTCLNRTKCTGCGPGMFTDSSQSFCAPCQSTCLTCGAYYDVCATCDPASNRVISNGRCVCLSSTYEEDGVCKLCSSAIPHCNSCENPYICTGCDNGFTLKEDLKECIDCEGSINGCSTCTSTTNCTSCKNPFTLIYHRCRCPINQYTSQQHWGHCQDYPIQGLKSSLGVQLQAHQHQNNTLIVFIRFRAKTLYVLNKEVNQSITMSINGVSCPINFDYIENNHIKVSTELNQTFEDPQVTITFSPDVFYNEDLLTLAGANETVVPRRLYLYEPEPIKSYQSVRDVLKYTFMILKWVFFGFSIIGQGHLLFPFVVFIQLMPLFLMLRMSLPANLSMVLDGMLSFQVKSIIPMFSIKSNFFVIFPPMTYDYYGLYDFLLFGKIGDMLLLIFVNVMTKFDEGIVRMFPPGKIRRYLYESLVRRGYAVMSLCILSFQPSLILLAGVYITYNQWESSQEIFNYCCCVFTFGFYLAYNFNHASNLTGTKLMKNIENQQCFFGINSQQPTAPRTTLLVLATDFWIIGSLHLVGPMIYFISCIFFLAVRVVLHIKRDYFIGKIQFALRTFTNIFLLAIYCIMFVFYLGEKNIYIGFGTAEILGIVATTLIFCYIFFHIIEKILYNFKLQTDFIENKVVQGQNGEKVIVVNAEGAENNDDPQKPDEDNESSRSHKMKQFFNNTSSNANNAFSGLNFRKKNQEKQQKDDRDDQHDTSNNNFLSNSYHERQGNKLSTGLPNRSDAFFKNSAESKEKQKYSRIKSANTSKYAKNHLELRYKAQGMLTKQPDRYDD